MRTRHSLVTWHKIIWFPYAFPKCGFILWLAIRERLGTHDRLHFSSYNWDCLLCNNQRETHDHLFFSCTFTKAIWERLKQKCYLSFGDLIWKECCLQMVNHCKDKSLSSIIRKLSLAVSVYYIWQERNSRFNENSFRGAMEVIWIIIDTICIRLSSLTGFPDNAENRGIQASWNLPDRIFG